MDRTWRLCIGSGALALVVGVGGIFAERRHEAAAASLAAEEASHERPCRLGSRGRLHGPAVRALLRLFVETRCG